ncbi:S8/S53 family peptidase [Leucobacter viscericola]|uniref:S8/S53 family peptidase n=1 Tax=Leucobacter viscericola TaxID=2714935 RepID=A0A6G7XJ28_9MICO|nr:S8/S53 family peptidase [Leucobacter viscericola]QIK64377.1 S8/S53 family peptidase [Leucobacter viscericola]
MAQDAIELYPMLEERAEGPGNSVPLPRGPVQDRDWNNSNVSVNLGGRVEGGYQVGDAVFDGSGQIVIDIDAAFLSENELLLDSEGNQKIIAEACLGTTTGLPTDWANLCASAGRLSSDFSYLFRKPAWLREGTDSAALSRECVTSGGSFCHSFHGTATAGAIVGAPGMRWEQDLGGSSGSYVRVSTAGAAPGARLFAIKVGGGKTGEGYGWSIPSVINALRWVDYLLESGIGTMLDEDQLGGKIAAVTIGISGASIPEDASCDTYFGAEIDEVAGRLKAKGVAVIMSAGVDAEKSLGTLNCGENVITVGASKTLTPHELASYSNFHPSTVLYAPVGEGDYLARDGVLLPWEDGGTAYFMGTSFSAAQVAGAFAVLREKFGYEPTVDEISGLLAKTGSPMTGPAGLSKTARNINIQAALQGTPKESTYVEQ